MSSLDVIELTHRESEGEHRFEIEVPKDLAFFEGHFEGRGVLAAAVQLDIVILPRVERVWPELGPFRRAVRVKFKKPIGPGDKIELVIAKKELSKVDARLLRDGAECMRGSLFFEEGSSE